MIGADTLGPYNRPWWLPVLFLQSWTIRARARRLPEPPGERRGHVAGRGGALRVLAVGDSAAAAVGASRQDAGLAPCLAYEIAARTGAAVDWAVAARTGLDAAGVLAQLDALLEASQAGQGGFDLIATSIGANDVFRLTASTAFGTRFAKLLARLETLLSERGWIVIGRAPPFHCSPLFREPLRGLVAWRVQKINRLLEVAAADRPRAIMTTGPEELAPADFAVDGIHPSESSYRVWGGHMVDRFQMSGPR